MTWFITDTPEVFRSAGAPRAATDDDRALLHDWCTRFVTEAGSLGADLANPTSNSVYQRIGYRPVFDYRSVAP